MVSTANQIAANGSPIQSENEAELYQSEKKAIERQIAHEEYEEYLLNSVAPNNKSSKRKIQEAMKVLQSP